MSIYDSGLWASDLDEALEIVPELQRLAGKSVMITGCTGLICSAVVDLIIRWNVTHDEKITILAAARNRKRTEQRFQPYFDEDWFIYVPYDASNSENDFSFSCDYIIHGACNATPRMIVREPVETMMSNFIGMVNLMEYARKQMNTGKAAPRILFVSSSEVYGRKEHNRPSKTDEYGWIDILNSRSSYSIGKCAAETLCASYYDEYGVESVIVRPGHIYGPTATEADNRVAAAWAYAAARGEDIVMKSNGSQIRSYCYCADCASAIMKVLLNGENVHAYNISNPDSIVNISEMAELLAKYAGTKIIREIPTDEERKGFNPMTNSSLDSTELLDLGWKGLFDAERGFSHTVRILREISEQS